MGLFKHEGVTVVGAHITGWSVGPALVSVVGQEPPIRTDVWTVDADGCPLIFDGDHSAALELAVTGKKPARSTPKKRKAIK